MRIHPTSFRRSAVRGCCLALWLLAGSTAEAQTKSKAPALTLQQAVQMALQRSNRMIQARAGVAAAEARHKSNRGRLGPSLDLSASVNIWHEALDVTFLEGEGDGSIMDRVEDIQDPAVQDVLTPLFEGLGTPTRVRGQVTSQIDVTLKQPLMVQLYRGFEISRMDRDSSRLQGKLTRRDVAFDTAGAYIQLKQADAGVEVARAAIDQVSAQLKQSKALFRGGVIGQNDVLRIEVAVAKAEADLIRAEGQRALARTMLAVQLKLPPSVQIQASQKFNESPNPYAETYEGCVRLATRTRLELKRARIGADMAEGMSDLAFWDMTPTLTALASYQNLQGQALVAQNAFFIGGMLTWNVWQWGAQYYALQDAKAKAEEAEASVNVLGQAIEMEIRKAYVGLKVAEKTLAVARKAVVQAEDAYRIEQVKYANGASTTADLLDSQLSVTQARFGIANALYSWYAARFQLARASGQKLPMQVLATASSHSVPRGRHPSPVEDSQ